MSESIRTDGAWITWRVTVVVVLAVFVTTFLLLGSVDVVDWLPGAK